MKSIQQMLITQLILMVGVFIISTAPFARAANFDTAMEAYKNGDFAAALKELHPLAQQGNTEAQYSLGQIYFAGRGVAQDKPEAIKWFTKAAEKGHAFSQYTLGGIYSREKGVLQDYTRAYAWLYVAASQGNETARTDKDTLVRKMPPDQIAKARKSSLKLYEKIYGGK